MIMENNDDKTPIGRLFGCIDYFDLEQFDSLIDNMNNTQSKFMIIKALEYSFEKGVFSLKESEIVSKCIRDLTKM
jgi:hypothetical protein